MDFPNEPKTAFDDYLYCSFLAKYRDWAVSLYRYAGFTDVEFNPHKSINCQARSEALFLSLMKGYQSDDATKSPESFIGMLMASEYRPQLRSVKWTHYRAPGMFISPSVCSFVIDLTVTDGANSETILTTSSRRVQPGMG